MLPSGDLLNLHVQSEAEKFLKPWWDVVIDYLVLVMVLIVVVCGVVGLYASGPVCIPVLRCPPQENSSALKKITCAMIQNSSRNGEDPLDNVVQFTNRNMFDYVNSECRKDIFCLVRIFPNMLLIIAGYCVVCSNAWFVIKSPILEQLSDLLQDCYEHASVISRPTSGGPGTLNNTPEHHATPQVKFATAEERYRVKIKCPPNSYRVKKSYTSEGVSTSQQCTALLNTTPRQHVTPTASTKERIRVNTKLCPCSPNSRSRNKSYTSEGASTSQQRTTLPTTTPQHATPTEFCYYRSTATGDRNQVNTKLQRFVNDFERNDTTNCPCCPHSWSCMRKSYIIITLFFQTAVAFAIFITLVWLMGERMNRQYECNIDKIIPDLVYDHFACTYSIVEFYFFGALAFSAIVGAYAGFSCLKLVSAIKPRWLLKTSQLTRINKSKIKSYDLKFLLKLVALSNSAYLDPFCEMHEEMNNDN